MDAIDHFLIDLSLLKFACLFNVSKNSGKFKNIFLKVILAANLEKILMVVNLNVFRSRATCNQLR